ncbi:ABC-2 type transport system permease protein [bacterium A37T11]|nr:ABC-2 type transport system permease protein [bacterium A37T11]
MKVIYKIAKAELKTLFFSPIAWLIIVVFTFQTSILFTSVFGDQVRRQILGWKLFSITLSTFSGFQGVFTNVQQYLYLYIPLLTMGVMSREFSSGSIKLLYSSPLTSRQIIFGKYLALLIYSGILTGLLALFGVFAACTIVHADIPVILTGLLGLFLLTAAYAAVGLFMSSLTSYTVVSAMGTLAIFALLNYVKGIGQDIAFVRDITYWLAITGRSDTFISGMISSEDLLYFLIVIALFVCLTIIKIQNSRQRSPWLVTIAKYAVVLCVAMLVGYFSSLPRLMGYYDATRTKLNTLTKSSQEVLSHLDQGLTITTYTNMLDENYYMALPSAYKYDVDRFRQYIRFKPEIKMDYRYYYRKTDNKQLEKQYPTLNEKQLADTLATLYDWRFQIDPYSAIPKDANLESEQFHFVRVLKLDNGKQAYLRIYNDMMRLPSEAEITAAFKRLVVDKLPTAGFVTGHGERRSSGVEDRGYNMVAQEKSFRYALINQGFDFKDVSLQQEIPTNIRILLIAEPKQAFSLDEMVHLNNYINNGGNLLIAGEPGRQEFMNPITAPLGVQFLPGTLVKPSDKFQQNLVIMKPTQEAADFSFHLDVARKREQVLPFSTAAALAFTTDKGFKVTTLFTSDTTGGWDELETTNFVDDSARLNTAAGEVEKPYPTVLALSRKIKNKEQKIIVTGDADWLSNAELLMSRKDVNPANFSLINTVFFWMTDNEVPIDMRRDPSPDQSLRLHKTSWAMFNIGLKWILPLLLAAFGTIIWIRRKGR